MILLQDSEGCWDTSEPTEGKGVESIYIIMGIPWKDSSINLTMLNLVVSILEMQLGRLYGQSGPMRFYMSLHGPLWNVPWSCSISPGNKRPNTGRARFLNTRNFFSGSPQLHFLITPWQRVRRFSRQNMPSDSSENFPCNWHVWWYGRLNLLYIIYPVPSPFTHVYIHSIILLVYPHCSFLNHHLL